MRFQNILPVLLILLAGTLRAQVAPCDIYDAVVETGDCTSDSTYKLWLNFKVENPGNDSFDVWTGANDHLGTFGLNQLPLQFTNFPSNNSGTGYVKFCIKGNPDCCDIKQFIAPICDVISIPCAIVDLGVQTGACNPDGSFNLWLNFLAVDPTNSLFNVWAGNQMLGTFSLSQLPLHIPHFPGSANGSAEVKVCINDNPDCCSSIQFDAPSCPPVNNPCGIHNLKVKAGDCTSDSTFNLWLSFNTPNTTSDSFKVLSANGSLVGTYALNQLPLTINNFPWSGDNIDALTVCISTPTTTCCKTREFNAPGCFNTDCLITKIKLEVGNCTSDSTYDLWVGVLSIVNVVIDSFEVYSGSGLYLGTFPNDSGLVHIANYPANGDDIDYIKVCAEVGGQYCCLIREFNAPDCNGDLCGIRNLFVTGGPCNDDGTYVLHINFEAVNASAVDSFQVYAANGTLIGTFALNQLPITIPHFPWNGHPYDAVKICIANPNGVICCRTREFAVPECLGPPCGIASVSVQTGNCNADGTYNLWVNVNGTFPTNAIFTVYAGNGDFLGEFPAADFPVHFEHFPWGGSNHDAIKVCLAASPAICCKTLEFPAPDCFDACDIYDLVVDPGNCTSDSSYTLVLNFQVNNPGNATEFGVWANGNYLGAFTLSQLPLTIADFPWNGGLNDVVKVCLLTNNGALTCCETKEFPVPGCLNLPCNIFDLVVDTGDCTSDSTYALVVNFQVSNANNATMFALWANGEFFGTFPLNQLPLTIPNFPWNGGIHDVVKVCLLSAPGTPPLCCETKEFAVPDCLNPLPCDIYDLVVDPGTCTSDSTYVLTLNFGVSNPSNSTMFGVWANGVFFGSYALTQLPLTIQNFPWNGGQHDVVKVCLLSNSSNPDCCETKEFLVPACLNPGVCDIFDVTVQTGDCNPDGTYHLWLNFHVENPDNNFFEVWATNGQYLGVFPLNALPLHIEHFPASGNDFDIVKICINDHPDCCEYFTFLAPDCGGSCDIYDLVVETGDCTSDSTYVVSVNFQYSGGGTVGAFALWANGNLFGVYPLTQLPLTITNFPWNGGPNDVVKICLINANVPPTQPLCCEIKEFPVPDCLGSGNCAISGVSVQTGDCNPDGTYHLWLNFQVSNPGNDFFEVWATNGQYLGTFPLNQLPLHIEHFPGSGNDFDIIKVCINDHPDCCVNFTFLAPDCGGGDCDIYDLIVDTGDCTSDSTYVAKIKFQYNNPAGATMFSVWANGNLFGTFPLNQLPLTIQNFPWNGGPNDVVKVCLLTANVPPSQALCCEIVEFPVPDCLGQDNCNIYDLTAVHTPCLCGQFFAVLTFKFNGVGNGGFDITGNGNNYGNFPYNTQQPIILGPLEGNGTTEYEFVVTDHNHPDCHDAVVLGKVDCPINAVGNDPNGGISLVLSPNPTAQWLQVSAKIAGHADLGQADVDIIQPDGRLVRAFTVGSANSFTLDVADLPAGLFRIVVKTAAGRLEGTFAKQ